MRKLSVSLAIILGILCLVVAVVYFTQGAGKLPHFFPGYLAGSAHIHTKHGLLFVGLAIVCALAAWMFSGPRSSSAPVRPAPTDKPVE